MMTLHIDPTLLRVWWRIALQALSPVVVHHLSLLQLHAVAIIGLLRRDLDPGVCDDFIISRTSLELLLHLYDSCYDP